MKVIIENLGNYTGEGATVTVNQKTRSFKFYDYKFTLGKLETLTMDCDVGGWTLELHGDDWEDKLTTIHFFKEHGEPDLARQVTRAVKWIANHV